MLHLVHAAGAAVAVGLLVRLTPRAAAVQRVVLHYVLCLLCRTVCVLWHCSSCLLLCHPLTYSSACLSPQDADKEIIKRIKEAGRLVDHVRSCACCWGSGHLAGHLFWELAKRPPLAAAGRGACLYAQRPASQPRAPGLQSTLTPHFPVAQCNAGRHHALLPLLLALRHAPHLQGGALLVCARGGDQAAGALGFVLGQKVRCSWAARWGLSLSCSSVAVAARPVWQLAVARLCLLRLTCPLIFASWLRGAPPPLSMPPAAAGQQREDVLGALVRQGEAVPQLAGERARLGEWLGARWTCLPGK